MTVQIASKNSLHHEALASLLSYAGYSQIQTTVCSNEVVRNHKNSQIRASVICYTVQPENFLSLIDKIQITSKTANIITIVPDLTYIELAGLIARKVAVLHVGDASEYLAKAILSSSQTDNNCSHKISFLSSQITKYAGHIPPPGDTLHDLTQTELRVASTLLQGYSNKCISNIQELSQQTIESHRKNIKSKLDLAGGKNVLLQHLIPYTSWIINSIINN